MEKPFAPAYSQMVASEESRQSRIGNVNRPWEEFRDAANQPEREIRVKQKLQRDMCSRPAREAKA